MKFIFNWWGLDRSFWKIIMTNRQCILKIIPYLKFPTRLGKGREKIKNLFSPPIWWSKLLANFKSIMIYQDEILTPTNQEPPGEETPEEEEEEEKSEELEE